MSILVRMLQIHTPDFVRKMALQQLFHATAAAFEAEVPRLAGLATQECLVRYARFTQAQAEQHLRGGGDVALVEQRLYRNAAEMGRPYGKLLRLGTVQDLMDLGRVLYRILDIDLQGDAQGEVVISRCYFSRFYSAQMCRLMSAMDRGLFAGLSNGGELTFSSRITEGHSCCRAHFVWAAPNEEGSR